MNSCLRKYSNVYLQPYVEPSSNLKYKIVLNNKTEITTTDLPIDLLDSFNEYFTKTSKQAVVNIDICLKHLLLRVNIVSSGLVDTPAYNCMNGEQKQEFFKQMGGQLTVGRVGQPEEVADIIETVLANNYLTGSVIDIDGGSSL